MGISRLERSLAYSSALYFRLWNIPRVSSSTRPQRRCQFLYGISRRVDTKHLLVPSRSTRIMSSDLRKLTLTCSPTQSSTLNYMAFFPLELSYHFISDSFRNEKKKKRLPRATSSVCISTWIRCFTFICTRFNIWQKHTKRQF
jgi:hypothetical protein